MSIYWYATAYYCVDVLIKICSQAGGEALKFTKRKPNSKT
jgi:hypothetical protein